VIRGLFCGSVPPEWGGTSGGGVASFHRTLVEEFAGRPDHGIEVAGLVPFNRDPATRCAAPPVRLFQPPDDRRLEAAFYAQTVHSSRADVVVFQHIAHRWPRYHGSLGVSVPALGVVHSWNSATFNPPERVVRVREAVEIALRACDRLVFVSAQTRADGESLGFSYPVATDVINNPLGSAFVSGHDVSGPRRGWVCLGSLIDRKNPATALTAAARLGADLTFVGAGPLDGELREMAASLGVGDRIMFAGWSAPEGVRDLLCGTELLCNPSLGEGFSLAYLEALACGVPIVGAAANVAELTERLGMPCGAGVTTGSVDEVVDRTRSVLGATWDRQELSSRTLARFSPSVVAAGYASILRSMASGVSGSGAHR
jgi:glycosyltransferase involved in cell wall biosynthesis